MPTCNQCGEEIEFRYVNGRCIPIHPGGGWHCGSWSERSSSPAPRISRAGEWRERDFTRPARCPICGDDVFFIRHNGGSVWVDELGWPWPKHGCFDQPNESTRTFSLWTAKSSGLTNPKLAIITRIKEDLRFAEPIVEIRFTDSSRASLIMRYTPSNASLLGALVIVSKEDGLLLHQEHAELPFHNFTPLHSTDALGYYTCSRCNAWVKEDTGHEEYCRTHYGKLARPADSKAGRRPKDKRAAATQRRRRQENQSRVAQPAPVIKPTAMPSPNALATESSTAAVEESIQLAMERIAKQAWAAVVSTETEGRRLKQAKQEALRLIRLLSASIRGQVEYRFTSAQWAPLRSHRPNS